MHNSSNSSKDCPLIFSIDKSTPAPSERPKALVLGFGGSGWLAVRAVMRTGLEHTDFHVVAEASALEVIPGEGAEKISPDEIDTLQEVVLKAAIVILVGDRLDEVLFSKIESFGAPLLITVAHNAPGYLLLVPDSLATSDAATYAARTIVMLVRPFIAPGFCNVEVDDLKTILSNTTRISAGFGIGRGKNATLDAAQCAIQNLFPKMNSGTAVSAMFCVYGNSNDVGIIEIQSAATAIGEFCHEDAALIWSHLPDNEDDGTVKTFLIAGTEE